MSTFLFIPGLPRMTGGLAVLSRLAAFLHAAGHQVVFVHSGDLPSGFATNGVECIPLKDARPGASDIWLVPEGFSNALAPGLNAGCRCLVYVQNWAYLHSALPPDVSWRQLPVEFLAVSQPVASFVEWSTGQRAEILRPGIDRELFKPVPERIAPIGIGPVRIAWMPRKNRASVQQIRTLIEARLPQMPQQIRLEWVELHNLSQADLARALQSCHLFLSSGFPEGLGLPPLEAMACGCLPVGFSGLGGCDYMRQAAGGHLSAWWPLPYPQSDGLELPPNGFYAPDADVWAAAQCLEQALGLLLQGGEAAARLFEAGQQTADVYSLERFEADALALWRNFSR